MNWDRIEGNWKQFKGNVRQQWGKLTDDQLDVIAGRRDLLLGRIQELYGISREETEKQLAAWQKWFTEKYPAALEPVLPVVKENAKYTVDDLVEYLNGPFSRLQNRWDFQPAGEQLCDVEFFISYEFKSRMFAMLMGAMFDTAFRRFSQAFERRADQVYGRPKTPNVKA